MGAMIAGEEDVEGDALWEKMEALGGVCRGVMDEVKGADCVPRLY